METITYKEYLIFLLQHEIDAEQRERLIAQIKELSQPVTRIERGNEKCA